MADNTRAPSRRGGEKRRGARARASPRTPSAKKGARQRVCGVAAPPTRQHPPGLIVREICGARVAKNDDA